MKRRALAGVLAGVLLAGSAPACEAPAGLAALRGQLLALVNAERAGLPVLAGEPRLDAAAQEQACRIAERGRLTHRGSWLAGLGRRLRREGYPYGMAVENTGLGHAAPVEVVVGWRESPGHRANLMNADAREAGFGVAMSAQGLAWVMIAAARE